MHNFWCSFYRWIIKLRINCIAYRKSCLKKLFDSLFTHESNVKLMQLDARLSQWLTWWLLVKFRKLDPIQLTNQSIILLTNCPYDNQPSRMQTFDSLVYLQSRWQILLRKLFLQVYFLYWKEQRNIKSQSNHRPTFLYSARSAHSTNFSIAPSSYFRIVPEE